MESVVYRGERFWLQSSGRYFQSAGKGSRTRSLHRRIYEDKIGPIPKGFCVHHINGDWRDNTKKNLKAMPLGEHQRMTMLKRREDPKEDVKFKKWWKQAQEKAKIWHASPAGREWHRQHAKQIFVGAPKNKRVCLVCQKEFFAWQRTTRFCSRSCIMKATYFRDKTKSGVCARCGKVFWFNKYRLQIFCSRVCAIYARNQKM